MLLGVNKVYFRKSILLYCVLIIYFVFQFNTEEVMFDVNYIVEILTLHLFLDVDLHSKSCFVCFIENKHLTCVLDANIIL